MRTITAGKKIILCTMIETILHYDQWINENMSCSFSFTYTMYLEFMNVNYTHLFCVSKYKNWLWFKKALNQIIKWVWCVWQWPLIRLHAWGLWSCSFDALRPTYLMSNCRNHTKCITPVQYINDKQLKKQWHK